MFCFVLQYIALCPTGDKLFITIPHQQKLLTLDRDGALLATCTDHELRDPLCVHLTPTNQVLVCGHVSNTIIQVHSMGRKKLRTLAKDDLSCPLSVSYNSLIVGQEYSNSILVYNVQCTGV
ncbi:hypothetical protein DPMN_055270 [Dreissena polymorpha]|uniref:Uncharacterized protein n=1 Tax=Dreissena polymorpha TaxID=45954 RepID=A0A9D4CQG6_DREPO|nr:hypothetical protein DPMN_055270 [Dreissena polymorpha]